MTSSRELGVPLTPEIAEALYIALVTDTGRFQYANTTPKALRWRPSWSTPASTPTRLPAVYESVDFAKLKLLARVARPRSGLRGRPAVIVATCCASDFAELGVGEAYAEGLIDDLRAVEGSELAATIREPPVPRTARAAGQPSREPTSSTSPRSRGRPAAAVTAGGGLLERPVDRRDHRVHPARVRAASAQATRCRRARLSPPASSWSTSRPGPRRSHVVAASGGGRARAPATRARSTRSRRGFSSVCPARRRSSPVPRRPRQALPDGHRPYRPDVDRRPGGRGRRAARAARRRRSSRSGSGLRGEVELPIPAASAVKIDGERAYSLHRAAWPSRCRCALESTSSTSRRYEDGVVDARAAVSSGTYVRVDRGCARRPLRTLRRTAVGPFRSRRGRLPAEALAAPGRRGAVDAAAIRRTQRVARPTRSHDGGSSQSAGGAAVTSRARRRSSSARPARSRSARSTASTAATAGARGGGRVRARADGRHVRPAPAARCSATASSCSATLERRLELLAEPGSRTSLVVEFTPRLAATEPEDVRRAVPARDRREVVRRRRGLPLRAQARAATSTCCARLGFDARPSRSSRASRRPRSAGSLHEGDVARRRRALLGRPAEVDGVVVAGDARGGTLGFPTANLPSSPALLVPRFGIYAGSARGHRAPRSRSATNPHYGGDERRIEAFLLDFAGDLYGRRLVVELWQRLRDEPVFDERAGADRPDRRATSSAHAEAAPSVQPPGAARRRLGSRDRQPSPRRCAMRYSAPPSPSGGGRRRPGCGRAGDEADAAEVVVAARASAARCGPRRSSSPQRVLVDAGLGVDDVAGRGARAAGRPPPAARAPRRGSPRDRDERRAQPRAAGGADREHEAVRRRSATLGAIMLSIRSPGASAPTSRSTSPSMLFRCRSSPGSQSPEPRPRLVVRTQALPSASTTTRFVVCASAAAPRVERVEQRERALAAPRPQRRQPPRAPRRRRRGRRA